MAQPTSHSRLAALFQLVAMVSFVPVARPQQACAKGVPTVAKIRGPELTRPIRLWGPDFFAPIGSWKLPVLTGAHYYKAAIFAASEGPVEHDEAPARDVQLGPRYEVVFFVWRDPKPRVLQYLYPFASSGPLTFTPPGQGRAFSHVLSEREISGWWSAPDELTESFQRKGIDPPPLYALDSPHEIAAHVARPIECG